MKTIPDGLTGEFTQEVTHAISAATVGSGTVAVLATPAMIAMMELAAQNSVQPYLESGEATVGTLVNIKHIKATPIGAKATAKSRLLETNGRELIFEVNCYDDAGLVGTGEHRRFVIDEAPFLEKANARRGKSNETGY